MSRSSPRSTAASSRAPGRRPSRSNARATIRPTGCWAGSTRSARRRSGRWTSDSCWICWRSRPIRTSGGTWWTRPCSTSKTCCSWAISGPRCNWSRCSSGRRGPRATAVVARRRPQPALTTLLNDAEPHIQRDALRAIVAIGTEQAYDVLRQAMATGSETMRNSLMLALVAMRDERAASLFGHIVRHVDYWSALGGVYLRSIEALGALRDEASVALLKDTLYQGRWWSPFRTAKLRATAAAALKRVGTPAAIGALEEAAAQGPRGVRGAARAELT